ncbi:MAG: SCO family protein [Terrimicrobiaceae bacterium]
MKKGESIPRLGWVIAFLGASILLALAFSSLQGTRSTPVPEHLNPISTVPDFQLLDQTGTPFGLKDLKGKIWVANFIFTRCQGPCPIMSSRMAELNKSVQRAGGGLELISFSVDPEFDRPEVLSAYASKLGANSKSWKFLTGTKAEIDAVVMKGLLQPLANEPDGTPAHSTRFVLVDREGRLRGYQDGNDPEIVQKLLMDIGDLMRESPSKQK